MGGLRDAIVRGFGASGAAAVCRRLFRDSCAVLTWHGVVPGGADPSVDREGKFVLESDFVRQLEFLVRHYRPVSLGEFERSCIAGAPLPERAVLVTIDDGYENVFTHMAPHFRRLGVPAALYVTTGFIETDSTLWTNQLELWWSEHLKRGEASDGNDGRPATLREMKSVLKSLSPSDRSTRLREWIGGAASYVPPGHLFRMMTWDQTRRIEESGVAIGSHTVTHAILAHEADESAQKEIVDSRRKLEEELRHPVTTFAYPNGGPGFFLPRDETLLEKAGYTVGMSMIRGRHRRGDDRYAIRRIAVGREEGWIPLFAARLAFPYELKDKLRR
jgi:peptidoglycan/xylan/chitin deacetylase (PgdA/CDA1 family)